MTDLLLIGEAPGKGGYPGEPALLGRIGRRLARLMGVTEDEYRWNTRRENLLKRWPGKASGNGSAWPAKRARRTARRMEDSGLFAWGRKRIVILLGRRVAKAFRFERAPWFKPTFVGDAEIIVAPHPSGASRWWNEPRNVRRAARFWRHVALRISACMALILLGACSHFRADPWRPLRAEASVLVRNLLDRSCDVEAESKEGWKRVLGSVAAADSAVWRLPFADTRVTVRACGISAAFDVEGPRVFEMSLTEKRGGG